jgi:hypothetical protein
MTYARAAVATLSVAALAGCSIADSAKTGMRPLDEQNALLVFTSGPFEGPASQRTLYADPSQREEYALYKRGGRHAEIVYITTRHIHSNNLSLDNWGTLNDMISEWNYTKSGVQITKDAFRVEADWTGFWAKPFEINQTAQHCAGFQAEWDGRADDPDHRPGKMIFGYMCEKAGSSFERADISKRIAEIAVRGISVKLKDEIIDVAAIPKAPSQQDLKTSIQTGSHGTPKFPYTRARSFRVGECGGRVPCP